MFPQLGCGLGLRHQHYPVITETWPKVDWFEAISENYMDTGGRPIHILEKVRQHYPIALHGTALSIGSTDSLNQNYLKQLKKLVDRIDPFIVSDHLCWSGAEGEALHDLLPLPFTEEAIQQVVGRVQKVQEFLKRRILLENVSTYVTYQYSEMSEWEFLTEVAKRSGCGILLDVNNVYVNSVNHQFNPHDYLKNLPAATIGQIHLAGHTDMGSYLFDTHSAPVIDSVWQLYREALKLFGPISTLIEWDEHIPPFERLLKEAEKAKVIYREFEQSLPVIARRPKADEAISRFEIAAPTKKRGLAMTSQISLSEIEQWMKSKIQPRTPSPSPLPLLGGEEKGEGVIILNPQGGATGEERLSVYANGYVARIRESLKEVYEAIHFVLGDERFDLLCRDYAFRYPSHDYNLNFVGIHLPEFLSVIASDPKGRRKARAKQSQSSGIASSAFGLLAMTTKFPFLVDLAKLEWLIWKAFHAFDESPVNPETLKNISPDDWETMRLIFQPSVSLLSSAHSVLDIWRARPPNCAAGSPLAEKKKTVSLSADWSRPQKILVGRKQDQVRCEPLSPQQFRLLEGLISGKTLGDVCERLAEDSSEEIPITAWFSNWMSEGLIARCELISSQKPVGKEKLRLK